MHRSSRSLGDTTRFIATVKDASDHVLTDRVVVWRSDSPAVATISATGLVSGVTPPTLRPLLP